jgi:hypothetical protein
MKGEGEIAHPCRNSLKKNIAMKLLPNNAPTPHEGQKAGGLAGLSGGVEDEIPLVVNQGFDFFKIEARQRRDHVVIVGHRRAGVVEFFHEGSIQLGRLGCRVSSNSTPSTKNK